MFKLLTWIHGLLLQLVLWALKLPFKAAWSVVLTVLALLGEEVRRWAGLVVAGLLILLAGKGTIAFAPAEFRAPLVMAVLLLAFIWALAVRRAAYWTAHNSLFKVRQRQWFRKLSGDVSEVRRRIPDGLAQATRGSPVGMVFKPNRDARAKATADAQEAERRAEADRRAAAAEERRLEELAALEPDPYV